MALSKPNTTFDSNEQKEEYLEELAARHMEYLDGALNDLREEQDSSEASRGSVEDPTVPPKDNTKELVDKDAKGAKNEDKKPDEVDEFLDD